MCVQHGETLAMKGLLANCLNKKEEAFELVRKGLKFDLKSHVCWHVYGLLYRGDKNYAEAIKCYRNALRIDKHNSQIMRDLANLQIHLRDYEGHVEVRRLILTSKANQRVNWVGFAVANHLNDELDVAVSVLSQYESTNRTILTYSSL